MREYGALVSVIGFFGLLGAANAETVSTATTVTAFDGTYRPVSSTRVNEMYTSYNGQSGQCPNRRAGPLHIVRGHAHYTTATGYRLTGTVGPQGELTMRSAMMSSSRPFRMKATGSIDGSGSAHARQESASCNYDFVWQKSEKTALDASGRKK